MYLSPVSIRPSSHGQLRVLRADEEERARADTPPPATPCRSVIGRGWGSGEHRPGSPVLEWRTVGISRLGGEGAIYTVTKASDRPAFIGGGLGTLFCCPC